MTEKTRNRPVPLQVDGLPDTYIKAKYLHGNGKVGCDMAGFEAGDPNPTIITDQLTGKRKFVIRLNGFVHIETNGDVLVLDTIFNRKKLAILTKPTELRVPKDSTGKEFTVKMVRPMFSVEDESIFEGLDEAEPTALPAKVTKAGHKPKGLKSVAEVEAERKRLEDEKTDNAEGLGGGRRPDAVMAPTGEVSAPSFDIES